jgi:hypothetical protein
MDRLLRSEMRFTQRLTVIDAHAKGKTEPVAIRTTKSILATRPTYHKCDGTIRGHVFCSFLAILLKTELEVRMSQMDLSWEWDEVIRGLNALHEEEAVFNGHRFLLRSQLMGDSHKAIRAAALPCPPRSRNY